jgi:ribosomal protein S18 acetylase RimI-like enzyme
MAVVLHSTEQLRSRGEVAEASGADPQCMWAAQGLLAGGAAWALGGAVVVACPALCGRDRLVVRGPAASAAGLVRVVVDAIGSSYALIGDPLLMTELLARLTWLEPRGSFGWMDCIRRPTCRPVNEARWLSRQEWSAADELLSVAYPKSFARPGVAGVSRWAGITDLTGSLTSIAADAWSSPGLGFLAGLAVAPEARRRGQGRDVGAFVLKSLLAVHGRVAMMVQNSHTAAIAMYAELGLTYRNQQVLGVRSSARPVDKPVPNTVGRL